MNEADNKNSGGGESVGGRPERQIDPSRWVDEYGDYMYRYALSRVRSPELAEEVVQEMFVGALKSVDQFKGTGAERAWLLGILKRKIADHFRRRARAAARETADEDVAEILFKPDGHWKSDPRIFGKRPESDLENSEFWKAFRACLGTLPQRQGDVFVMRELDGRQSDEICSDLNLTSSNLWVLLHRARLKLANCLKNSWQAA